MAVGKKLGAVALQQAIEGELGHIDELRQHLRAYPEDVHTRIRLVSAYGKIAELHANEERFKQSVASRRVGIGIAREAGEQIHDNLLLRIMLGTQLNGLGFTLREMEDWRAALAVYRELADLLDDGGDGSGEFLSLMAMAQDGIGDVQDTLGDPAARDDAWERARILFQSCLHAKNWGAPMENVEALLQDVIDKQNEFR